MISKQLIKIINLIVILVLISSSCFAKDERQSKSSHSVINMSKLISYKNSKTEQRHSVTFETIKESSNINKKIMEKPTSTNIIESDLDFKAEKTQISRQQGAVTRSGKILAIKRQSAPPFEFKDYYKLGNKNQEGDSQKYIYAGLLGSTGYHKIEVEYMHDSSGTYFVNPNVDSILYAHTSDHSAFLSESNRILIINNSINPPFGLVITRLSKAAHKIELHCISNANSESKQRSQFEGWNNKINGEFKGWHESPEIGFDLLIKLPNIGLNAEHNSDVIPIQFSFYSEKWHIFVPEAKQKHLSSRLSCWQ